MLLPPFGKAARPVDLFESEIPRVLELDVGAHRMIAVFNWGEEPARIDAPLSSEAVRVLDAWSREDPGLHEGSISVDVPPHGCRLLAVRRAGDEGKLDQRGLPPLFRWSR
jgi:hypothetical protein